MLLVDEDNSLLVVQSIPTKVEQRLPVDLTGYYTCSMTSAWREGKKGCREEVVQNSVQRDKVAFNSIFVKVLAFRVGLITKWREIPPLSSASRTHSMGVMWTEHFKVCVPHDMSQV